MLTMQTRQGSPLYLQIKQNVRLMLVTGSLAEGEPLPAPREVAAQYAINPAAVTRAYGELAAEGYLRRQPEGSYVPAGSRPRSGSCCAPWRTPPRSCCAWGSPQTGFWPGSAT